MGKKKGGETAKKSAETAAAPAAAPTTPEAPSTRRRTRRGSGACARSFTRRTARRRPLLPTDGAPSVLSKEKFILVADAGFAAQVASGAAGGLPAHQHVQLWHLGKQKADGVRFGLAEEDGLFKHPALDVGGLTNLRQKLGEAATFAGDGVAVGDGAAADAAADALVSQWKALAKRELPPTLAADIAKFVGSVAAAMGEYAVTLRLHALPPEHRVVVTSADVAAATGKYCVRVFGGDDHAKLSDGAGLYCGVAEKFVTPNLSAANLESEYAPYGDDAPRTSSPAAAAAARAAAAAAAAAAAGSLIDFGDEAPAPAPAAAAPADEAAAAARSSWRVASRWAR